jgi:hypothetical protein
LQFDGSNFRVVEATPATAAALGMLGTSGITHWSFPASSAAYDATAADNGNMISSFNSPQPYLAVTLPPVTAINPGWTIGIAQDNGKGASVQVNSASGGEILMPGVVGATTSFSLADLNDENAVLQFDGSNFRVVSMTPISRNENGGGPFFSYTPPSSSAPCKTTEMAQDSNYIYLCTAPNTWMRAALSSF